MKNIYLIAIDYVFIFIYGTVNVIF